MNSSDPQHEDSPDKRSALAASPEGREHGACAARDETVGGPPANPPGIRTAPGGESTLMASRAPDAEQQGTMIGRYKLLQNIGEGGFGTVWMAEQQQPVRRRVALKIIKAGMDTREVVARFEQERQALAMMDHPNIARVFDAGSTEAGRPYFVMELVKGIPITDFCDARKLGTRERLTLFADVCSAMNHAHQKGIIHRDIKPSNVMVTLHGDKPVPKVIDFGIAKATQSPLTDMTIFTRFEQFVGTPAYMSPEQAALSGLDIDTRSDIYALGILLYELLTGRPPFDPRTLLAAGYDEMRRIIREVDPPKPSARLSTVVGAERSAIASARHVTTDRIDRLVEPDLDWIVMRAIDKDRARRYETANAFALDIQHFLSDEAVSATPPGAGYLLKKFARRHRMALRVAAVITVLLIGATIVSMLLAYRALDAEKSLAEQLHAVAAERDEKEIARGDAEEIVRFLTGILESPDPAHYDREITVAESLDRATRVIETSLTNRPERQIRVKAALGKAYSALGEGDKAISLQEQVLDFFRTHQGADSADTIHAMAALAWSYDYRSRRPESIKLYREILQWHIDHLPPLHSDTTMVMGELGRVLWFSGSKGEGTALQEEALRRSRTSPGVNDPRTQALMHWVALAYMDAGRADEARLLDDEHLKLSNEVLGANHPQTLRARSAAASHMTDARKRSEVQAAVVAASREVNGVNHPYTLAMAAQQASSLREAGDHERALQMYEDIFTRMVEKNTLRHSDTLWVMSSLASLLHEGGQKDQRERALKMRVDAVRISEEFLGPEHYDTLGSKARLACSYNDAGRFDEAIWLREQLLPVLTRVRGLAHSDTGWVRGDLLVNYQNAGRRKDVVRLRREMLAASIELHGEKSVRTLKARQSLALDLSNIGQHDEAITLQEETLKEARILPPSPETTAIVRGAVDAMARCYEAAGRTDRAAPLRTELGTLQPKLAPVRSDLLPPNAEWTWLHPVDGVDPAERDPGFHEKFFLPKFNDAAWTKGNMQGDGFGYGDDFTGTSIGTPPEGRRHTAWFRLRFTTAKPFTSVELRARRDDGMIVYLDEREIIRDNVAAGPDSWLLPAIEPVSREDIAITRSWKLERELPAGDHLLAISVHNVSPASSDLRLGQVSLVELEPDKTPAAR